VQTYNITHAHATYLNLELLQAHGLIDHDAPICSSSDSSNETTLNIFFKDHGSYARAKQHWKGRDDMFFVVEDASCVEGEGVRSIYL